MNAAAPNEHPREDDPGQTHTDWLTVPYQRRWSAQNSALGRLFVAVARWRVPVLSKVVMALLGSELLCPVPRGLITPHPYGIIVHPRVQLGEDVLLQHQTTIGLGWPGQPRAPRIGNGVYIGAGAKILGDCTIGAGATVGANAVVTRDVPPGSVAVGFNRVLPPP